MVLIGLLAFGFEHLHKKQLTMKYCLAVLLAAVTVSVAAHPQPALAFEMALPISLSNKLLAPVNRLPADSYRGTGIIAAYPSPVTETGEREPVRRTKLAQAPVDVARNSDGLVVLRGEASYYSRAGCLGCHPAMIMANGQPLNDSALTMAIGANLKHLVGHKARVTSLVTGKSVTVTITDTGGFYQAKYGHRVADLTVATKNAIGMSGGVGQVKVEVF